MIALDTSVILAMALDEPESEQFRSVIGREALIIGWPTLLEARMVLTGKGFPNASAIIDQIVRLPNVTTIAFDESHYRGAELPSAGSGKDAILRRSTWATVSLTLWRRLPTYRFSSKAVISARQISNAIPRRQS